MTKKKEALWEQVILGILFWVGVFYINSAILFAGIVIAKSIDEMRKKK